MLKPEGYSIITEPGKSAVEHDTFTCAHCRQITFTKGGIGRPLQVAIIKADGNVEMRDVHKCFRCDHPICPRCVGGECYPGMKRIEDEEALSRKLVGI